MKSISNSSQAGIGWELLGDAINYDISTAKTVTKLLIPTHAHFHWLKFIKNI